LEKLKHAEQHKVQSRNCIAERWRSADKKEEWKGYAEKKNSKANSRK
jgi:hypothetical protein